VPLFGFPLAGRCADGRDARSNLGAVRQRDAMGLLFLFLGFGLLGIALGAARSTGDGVARFVVGSAAIAIGVWLVSLSVRAFRKR